MGQLEDLKAFVDVVNSKGIARAAETLSIAKSAVSRRLRLIEERYETQLIDRRPGVWEVTPAGRELYQRATNILSDAEDLDADFQQASQTISGPLSLSLPSDFGSSFLGPFLTEFAKQYPEIRLHVDFDDRQVDLTRENYDFAVRISDVDREDLLARKLGSIRFSLYASPDYLETADQPQNTRDLHNKSLLHFGTERRATWRFQEEGKQETFEFQPVLNSNTGLFLLEATVAGLGIARLPDFIADSAVRAGHIVPVLPDLIWPQSTISLVNSKTRILTRRMRVFETEITRVCTWCR